MPNTPRKTGSKTKLKAGPRKRQRSDRPLPRKAPHRPPTYNAKLHDQIAYLISMSEGTNVELAKRCGISESLLYVWLKKHPTFLEAFELGLNELKEHAFVGLLKRIKGFTAVDIEEKADTDGNIISRITRKKEIIPDVSAIALTLGRIDRRTGPDMDKVDALINFIHALTPNAASISKNKVDKDDDIEENE